MLTFEEFFQKKKINLVQFQAAEPGLFAEFSSHYPLMGEKSFDHTKKYWFNGLRRSYPLAEAVKPHAVQAEAISPMAVQGVAAAAAQNLDAGMERPKFTEDNLTELVDENVSVKEVSLAEEEKIIVESNLVKSEEKKSEEREPAKPAFKPRFNIQNIKKDVVKEASEESNFAKNEKLEIAIESELTKSEDKMEKSEERESPHQSAKPAFKPRFNMQNIKKDVVKEASETEAETSESKVEIKTEPATENLQLKTEPAKPAFKPRFNMQNIKKDVIKEASETKIKAPEPEVETKPELTAENPQPETNKPYKPRFQMKNTPKPPTDQA